MPLLQQLCFTTILKSRFNRTSHHTQPTLWRIPPNKARTLQKTKKKPSTKACPPSRRRSRPTPNGSRMPITTSTRTGCPGSRTNTWHGLAPTTRLPMQPKLVRTCFPAAPLSCWMFLADDMMVMTRIPWTRPRSPASPRSTSFKTA